MTDPIVPIDDPEPDEEDGDGDGDTSDEAEEETLGPKDDDVGE